MQCNAMQYKMYLQMNEAVVVIVEHLIAVVAAAVVDPMERMDPFEHGYKDILPCIDDDGGDDDEWARVDVSMLVVVLAVGKVAAVDLDRNDSNEEAEVVDKQWEEAVVWVYLRVETRA